MVRYSSVLSHCVCAGTSIYCLTQVGTSTVGFPQVSYGIMAVRSIVGIIRYCRDMESDSLYRFSNFTQFMQMIFTLPCITTSIWLQHGYMWEAAYAHTFVSFIPLVAWLGDHNNSQDLVHLIIVCNTLSLGIVSFLEKNWYGVGAAVAYGITHFLVREEDQDFAGIPVLDCYNYGLSIFAFVSCIALGGKNPFGK